MASPVSPRGHRTTLHSGATQPRAFFPPMPLLAASRQSPPAPLLSRRSGRRAFAAGATLLCVLSLCGCSLFRKKNSSLPRPATAAGASAAAPTVRLELGRIIGLQPEARTALVEFVPQARPPANLAGRALLARKLDTLEVTAKLVASPHQRGRILGVYVISGTPGLDDEVVLDPEN